MRLTTNTTEVNHCIAYAVEHDWTQEIPKGEYEIARLIGPEGQLALFYRRERRGCSTFGDGAVLLALYRSTH